MQQSIEASPLIDFLKTVAPWITGGLAGAILTLATKYWSERSRRRIINVDIRKQRFSLPDLISQDVYSPDELTVSYKDKKYDHLSIYTVLLKNIGYSGVNGLELVVSFPTRTLLVDSFLTTSPTSIFHQEEDRFSDQKPEKVFKFDRIERDDNITISFLLNCDELDKIQCLPRGIDDVEYFIGEKGYQTEIQQTAYKLLIYLAVFISLGAVPIVWSVLQAFVVVLATPSLMKLINLTTSQRRIPTNQIEIENITIEGSRKVSMSIGQHFDND
jgi:hypothetical protein